MFEPVVMLTLRFPGEVEIQKSEFIVSTGENLVRRDLSKIIFRGNRDIME
jgi:hypothetical protein